MRRDHHREDEEDAPTVRMAGDHMRVLMQDLATPVTPPGRVAAPLDSAFDEASLEEQSVPHPALTAPAPHVAPSYGAERVWIAGAALVLAGLLVGGALLL